MPTESNIIDLDFKSAATFQQRPEDEAKNRTPQGHYCDHRRVYIVGTRRLLECRDCGQIIEPFDWIMQLARKDFSIVHAAERLTLEAEVLRRDVERLKRQRASERRTNRQLGLDPNESVWEEAAT